MHVDEFENILNEFSSTFDCVKSLYRKIRDILFSFLENKALFTETSSKSSEKLYKLIIEAFDNTISKINVKQKSRKANCLIFDDYMYLLFFFG